MSIESTLRRIRIPFVEDFVEVSPKRGLISCILNGNTVPLNPRTEPLYLEAEEMVSGFENHRYRTKIEPEIRKRVVDAFAVAAAFEKATAEGQDFREAHRVLTQSIVANLAYATHGRVTYVLEPEIQSMFLEGDMSRIRVRDLQWQPPFYLALPESRLEFDLIGTLHGDYRPVRATAYGITTMTLSRKDDAADENTTFLIAVHYRMNSLLDESGEPTGTLPPYQEKSQLDGILTTTLPFGLGQPLSYADALDLPCESILWDHLHPQLSELFTESCVVGLLEAVSLVFGVLAYTRCDNADIVPFDTTRYEQNRRNRVRRARSAKAKKKAAATPASGGASIRYVAPAIASALRARQDAKTSSGRTVRPHLRGGHFRRYYTGRRLDDDGNRIPLEDQNSVIHWIPPQIVGSGEITDSIRILT